MSRRSALALVVILAISALGISIAATKPAKPRVVTVTEKDSKTRLKVGDTLLVRLQSTPGTGYSWQTTACNTKLLKQLGEPAYEQGARPIPGSPGHQVFKFKALAAGKTTLELHYVRPWEKNRPPAKVYKLNVSILKPAKPHKK